MKYVKPSQDAYGDFVEAREQIEAAGFEMLAGAWAGGVLTVETDQPIPADVQQSLGLTVEQGA